jgi:5'(3')-deoxyribonucleotidase
MKTKLFLDMDGVLADFVGAVISHPDYVPGAPLDSFDVFEELNPIPNAIESVKKILNSNKYDVFVLSTAPWDNPKAWMDKRLWIEKHLPELKKRVILTHHKDLCCSSSGKIIIDDRIVNGVEKWNGVHLHFGTEYKDWNSILEYLNV